MADASLIVENLSKSFVVPCARDDADPRRERLSRSRDRFHALRGVSFEVPRGQTLGVIGANGSGKSTLLKILSGVTAPDGGTFNAQGRVGALLELGAGFHPDLTGVENVYLNGALLGLGAREIDRMLPEIIAFAELERFMDMPVRHFSSGMSARLGFAVASRLAPDILLMDETFAAGDARFQAKALAQIADLKARGHTMLIVSHNVAVILTLCDRIVWIDQGRLRRDGKPTDIIAEYFLSQQRSMHQIHHLRAALGMESIFGDTMGEASPVRITGERLEAHGGPERPESEARELRGATKPPTGTPTLRISQRRLVPDASEAAEGAVPIAYGGELRCELTLEHPGPNAPRELYVETAWVRTDHRIVAQGRTLLRIDSQQPLTTHTLTWKPWRLTEGEYRLAMALTPVAENEEIGKIASGHYTRKLDCGLVRVTTPNTNELPALTTIASEWKV